MNLKFLKTILLAGTALTKSYPTVAADLIVPVDTAAVEPAPIRNRLTFEVLPAWKVTSHELSDYEFKLGYSRFLGNGWSWDATGKYIDRTPSDGTHAISVENTLDYAWQLTDRFSVPLNAGIAYRWDQKAASSALSATNWAYYFLNAGLSLKLNSHWSWNMVSARYRNALEGGWETPKISTGVTYKINQRHSVFAKTGYSWKNGDADKINAAFGYKFSF